METLIELLPILIPFMIIEIVARVYAIVDIYKPERATNLLGKTAWTVLIILVNFAWVVYLLGGRGYASSED